MAEQQNKSKSNYFEFWKKHTGREVTVHTHDNKKFTGILRTVLISHMNIILDTEKEHLAFRGQVIHHISIPRGK